MARRAYLLGIVQQPHDTIPLAEWVFRARRINADTRALFSGRWFTAIACRGHLADDFGVQVGSPTANLTNRLVRRRSGENPKHAKGCLGYATGDATSPKFPKNPTVSSIANPERIQTFTPDINSRSRPIILS